MGIDMISIGARIKARRKELGLTQTDMYQQCGINSGALSRIENGTRTPSVLIFYEISQILGCDMEWLITGNSANKHIFELRDDEKQFVIHFRELPEDEKEELTGILEMKLQKVQKVKRSHTKSSHFTDDKGENMVS